MKEERGLLYAILVAAILHTLVILIPSVKTGAISGAVRFGCVTPSLCYAKSNQSLLPENAPIYRSGGYDGQFYYLTAHWIYSEAKPVFDSREFRLARIGYPALAGPGLLFGRQALIVTMALLPIGAHLFAIWMLRSHRTAMWLFAVNPFSVLSAGLFLADGLALSLAMSASVLIFREEKTRASIAQGCILLTIAILCKETMLSLALACFSLAVSQRGRWGYLAAVASAVASAVPLMLWWDFVGFSPLAAANRGIAPGFLSYISQPDSILSGRGFLLLYGVLAALFVPSALRFSGRSLAGAIMILCGLTLTLLASREYWNNFANVARLLAPAAGGIVLCAEANARFARPAIWFSSVFSCLILFSEARSNPDVFTL